MDLIVWYTSDGGTIRGFQLCYEKQTSQHALTWLSGSGYNHSRVDDGEATGEIGLKQTPILVEDGTFDPRRLEIRFRAEAASVDPQIVALVCERLRELAK